MRRSFFTSIACLACAATANADEIGDAGQHVVLAQTAPNALLLWNASPEVASMVRSSTADSRADDELERGALKVALANLPLVAHAKVITVRILYDKTGDVSPIYGGATFAGVERYATLTLDGDRARADDGRWKELKAKDPVPAWITFRILGTLPAR